MKIRESKLQVLQRFCEEAKYTCRDLADMMFGNSGLYEVDRIHAMLSKLRRKGFNYYPIGNGGIVKIPSTNKEIAMVQQSNHKRAMGGMKGNLRLERFIVLERPKFLDKTQENIGEFKKLIDMGGINKPSDGETVNQEPSNEPKDKLPKVTVRKKNKK